MVERTLWTSFQIRNNYLSTQSYVEMRGNRAFPDTPSEASRDRMRWRQQHHVNDTSSCQVEVIEDDVEY